jgi:Zn-dependent peptidase ImmA (M78 family)/DNA-binding XRE family transcriptional regulator
MGAEVKHMSSRIRELRERQNLKQEELGELVGVTRQTIAAWEKGQRQPSMTQLTKVARALGAPTDLLLNQEGRAPATEVHLLFRSDRPGSLTTTDKELLARRARDYATIERIAGELPLLPESRPLDGYLPEAVENVAKQARDWLRVEVAPLGDVFDLLERRGLKVIRSRLPDRVWGFSAYTEAWGGVIFVNTHSEGRAIPTERQYFTALHELGHLIFHRREYTAPNAPTSTKDPREDAANHFAGAVLLPADAISVELRWHAGRWLPEPLLCDLKQRYGASVGTILRRAETLGIIGKKQMGQQFGKLKKNYPETHGEPTDCEVAPPARLNRLKRLVFDSLVTEKITASRAAEILSEPLVEIRNELAQWLPEEDEAVAGSDA